MKKKILGIALAVVMIVVLLGTFSFIVGAAAASEVTVTIGTGASVTLKDTDGDGYYDIGTADELYAFAALVNGGTTGANAVADQRYRGQYERAGRWRTGV